MGGNRLTKIPNLDRESELSHSSEPWERLTGGFFFGGVFLLPTALKVGIAIFYPEPLGVQHQTTLKQWLVEVKPEGKSKNATRSHKHTVSVSDSRGEITFDHRREDWWWEGSANFLNAWRKAIREKC